MFSSRITIYTAMKISEYIAKACYRNVKDFFAVSVGNGARGLAFDVDM